MMKECFVTHKYHTNTSHYRAVFIRSLATQDPVVTTKLTGEIIKLTENLTVTQLNSDFLQLLLAFIIGVIY